MVPNMLEKLPASVGRALRRARPGLPALVYHGDAVSSAPPVIEVASPAFADREAIPKRYTADGDGLSPPLRWSHVPEGTRSIALIVEDADSPTPAPLVHAIAWQIYPWRHYPTLGQLSEGELMAGHRHPSLGINSYLRTGWLPPDPPPGHGPHRYGLQLFALDHAPALGELPGRHALLRALRGHTVARGLLIGLYER
jgi:Raf kinase inhibitor-like YbhB/YbcL family protein